MVPLNLRAAKLKMARLMYTRDKFQQEHSSGESESGLAVSAIEEDASIVQQYRDLEYEVIKFSEELAAHPLFSDIMISWMVDIHGTGHVEDDSFKTVIDDQDFKAFVNRTGGNLAAMIQEVVEEAGFHITDRGGGGCSWHIGIPCNDAEARALGALVHLRFQKALVAGLIDIRKKFWKHRLPGLYNGHDAERYLEENQE